MKRLRNLTNGSRIMNRDLHRLQTREDCARLARLLRDTLREAGRPAAAREELRILDLACGRCDEAQILAQTLPELFAPPGSATPSRASLVGIDVRRREIDDARARCRSWLDELSKTGASDDAAMPHFEFLAADATKVDSHREIGENFDVVFLRHQNLYDGAATWRKIFDQGLAKLSPDGLLIFTSYFDREHELALAAFRDLGARIVLSRENPSGRRLKTPGKVIDKHMAVIRAAGAASRLTWADKAGETARGSSDVSPSKL